MRCLLILLGFLAACTAEERRQLDIEPSDRFKGLEVQCINADVGLVENFHGFGLRGVEHDPNPYQGMAFGLIRTKLHLKDGKKIPGPYFFDAETFRGWVSQIGYRRCKDVDSSTGSL